MAQFVGCGLDAVFTWEGREKYKDVIDADSGRKKAIPSGEFYASMPKGCGFVVNALVECLTVKVPNMVEVKGKIKQQGSTIKPKMRIDYNSYSLHLADRYIDALSPNKLKELFFADLMEEAADPVGTEVERVRDEE